MVLKDEKLTALIQDAAALLLLFAAAALLIKKMWLDGIFYEADDVRHHVVWLQHFYKHLSEGIIYPRWLADTNYGYGSPTFVFYPPLVYYCGSVLLALGIDIQKAIAILCFLAIYGAGITSYLYCRYRASPLLAFVGAIAYSTAPYLVFNIFVRCALAEAWALILIPIGFLLTELALRNSQYRLGIAVFYALLTLTHLPSLLIFTIIWLPYVWILSRQHPKPFKYISSCLTFMVLGCLSVAFYLLPVLFERSLVNLNSMKSVSGGYMAHFVVGDVPDDRQSVKRVMSVFNRTLPLLIFSLTISVCNNSAIASSIQRPTPYWHSIKARLYAVLTGLIIFLISSFSIPIWNVSSTLQMIQFPWRMLGVFSLFTAAYCSSTAGQLMSLSRKRSLLVADFYKVAALIMLGLMILSNSHYSLKLSRSLPGYDHPGDLIMSLDASEADRRKVGKYQYLGLVISQPFGNHIVDVPEYRPLIPDTGEAAPEPVPQQSAFSVIEGQADVQVENWQSYSRRLTIRASERSKIQLKTYYYPAWRAYLDGTYHPIEISLVGKLLVSVEPGNHELFIKYRWTTAFIVGIVISAICIAFLLLSWLSPYKFPRLY